MKSALAAFVDATNPRIVDQLVLPPRPERRHPTPRRYRSGMTGAYLTAKLGCSDTLWRHQSLALQLVAEGKNVVISTGTASGKSQVFQTAAIDALLHGTGTVLMFSPMLALSGDQLIRWEADLVHAGLPATLVGEVNGHVPVSEREAILERSRIVIMTPDVAHAWLLRSVASSKVQRFLASLSLLILDEAHLLEAAFGSNVAMMLRRLRLAQAIARGAQS